MMCRDFSDPPDVAVCFGGHPRVFTNELIYRSIQSNVLQALGTIEPPTIFAYMPVHDVRGLFESLKIESNASEVERVLKDLGAHPDNYVLPTPPLSEVTIPPCEGYSFAPGGYSGVSYDKSLAGQIRNRHECHNLIRRAEVARGRNFTWVLYTRPDMLWYRPLAPWCSITSAIKRRIRRWDWALLIERSRMEEVMSEPYKKFMDCRAPFVNMGAIETWMDAHMWNGNMDFASHDLLPGRVTRSPGLVISQHAPQQEGQFPEARCDFMTFSGMDETADCALMSNENSCNRPAVY